MDFCWFFPVEIKKKAFKTRKRYNLICVVVFFSRIYSRRCFFLWKMLNTRPTQHKAEM